jgi:hypothetical protein
MPLPLTGTATTAKAKSCTPPIIIKKLVVHICNTFTIYKPLSKTNNATLITATKQEHG